MKRFVKVIAPAVLSLSMLSACGSAPPVPEDSFYRLSPRAEAPADDKPLLDGIVEVDRFAASGSIANRPLLFSEPGSSAVSEYHYHFWIEAPPILLQNALVSYLRSSNLSKRVVTPEMRVNPDYTVHGRVMRLETVLSEPPVGIVELELSLRRESDGELLVLGEYRAEVPSGPEGVRTDVSAIDKAVNQAFHAFVVDVQNQ